MAEGGGLLNRYTVKSRIGGSNPPLSAILPFKPILPSQNCIPRCFESFDYMQSTGFYAQMLGITRYGPQKENEQKN